MEKIKEEIIVLISAMQDEKYLMYVYALIRELSSDSK